MHPRSPEGGVGSRTFDLTAAYAARERYLGRTGDLGLIAAVAVAVIGVGVAVYRAPVGTGAWEWYLLAASGGALVIGVGALIRWSTTAGCLISLSISEDGLTFQPRNRPGRSLRWSDPAFSLEVYDTTRLPPSNELAQSVAPFGYGLSTFYMRGLTVRTAVPRELYESVLQAAKDHGLTITPTPDNSDTTPDFRIHHVGVPSRNPQ